MARRGRRGGKRKNPSGTSLSQYGYPSDKQLRKEAAGIANASVPTVRATTRPFKRQQQQVSGWLDAVLGALNDSSGQVTTAYNNATAQQTALDQAAQARLAGLGLGDFGTGVQAAQGARGDSAAAQLISRGAAAGAYAGAQPGIATGYSNVQHATVQKGLRDALAQRRDLRAQAFGQAMQTVQQNALQRSSFLAGRQDARAQRSQYAQGLQLQQSQQAEQTRQFNQTFAQSERHWQAEFKASSGIDPNTGKKIPGWKGSPATAAGTDPHPGWTNGQWQTMSADTFSSANAAMNHGVPVNQVISEMRGNGIPGQIIMNSLRGTYGKLKGPNKQIHPKLYQAWLTYQQLLNRLKPQPTTAHGPAPGSNR